MKSKRIFTLITILLFLLTELSAIGFGYHIMEIRNETDFSKGILPTSILYQFNFPIPDIIPGSRTSFAFRLDNGLDFRKIQQDPITGKLMEQSPEKYQYPRDYMTFFDEFCFTFAQGFLKNNFTGNDALTLEMTLGGRFEKSYERLSYMSNQNEMEGLFFSTPGTPRFDSYSIWYGTPELKNDRNSFGMNLSIGIDLNYMRDKITRRDGIRNSFWIRYTPNENLGNVLIWNNTNAAFTLFALKQNGTRDTTWVSMVLEDTLTYRYLAGSNIPYYLTDTGIWNIPSMNTNHYLSNRIALTLYGPQINSYDVFPALTAFFDLGLSTGKVNNTSIDNYSIDELAISTGIKAELVLFDIARFYVEYGYIIKDMFGAASTDKLNIGFSIGI